MFFFHGWFVDWLDVLVWRFFMDVLAVKRHQQKNKRWRRRGRRGRKRKRAEDLRAIAEWLDIRKCPFVLSLFCVRACGCVCVCSPAWKGGSKVEPIQPKMVGLLLLFFSLFHFWLSFEYLFFYSFFAFACYAGRCITANIVPGDQKEILVKTKRSSLSSERVLSVATTIEEKINKKQENVATLQG